LCALFLLIYNIGLFLLNSLVYKTGLFFLSLLNLSPLLKLNHQKTKGNKTIIRTKKGRLRRGEELRRSKR
jgi:hypothetical protein